MNNNNNNNFIAIHCNSSRLLSIDDNQIGGADGDVSDGKSRGLEAVTSSPRYANETEREKAPKRLTTANWLLSFPIHLLVSLIS